MSFSRWMGGLWYIQTVECYSVRKRNDLSSHERTWRNVKCILLREGSQSGKAAYGGTASLWRSGKGQTRETVKISGCQGFRKGWVGGAQGIFRAVKLLYMVLEWWIHCTFVKMHSTYTAKSEPWYKLWILVTNSSSVLVHPFNKCTTLMQDVNNMGAHVHSIFL